MLAVCQGIVSCFHSASSGSGTAQERLFGVQPKAQGLVSLWLPLSPKGDPSIKVSRTEQSVGFCEADFEPGEADLARPLDFDQPPSCQRRGMAYVSVGEPLRPGFRFASTTIQVGFHPQVGLVRADVGSIRAQGELRSGGSLFGRLGRQEQSPRQQSREVCHCQTHSGLQAVQNAQRCQVATDQKGSNHENMTCAEEICVLRRLAGYNKSSFNHECGWPPWNPLDQQSAVSKRFLKP